MQQYKLLTPGSMKTTIVFPIRDTPTDNMTLRLKCEHLTPILAVVFVLQGKTIKVWWVEELQGYVP